MGSNPRPGSEVAGYRLESLLGRGGMGAVYRAEDVRLGRPVALKLLVPELAESQRFRERFLRESQLAASLDHPHIVPIYAAGEADGQLYLAMRYVEGYDLRQLLAREERLPPERALRLVEQIGDALDAAHERGLIHRDVKPGNVLITGSAGREHCYLADFGLTKQTASISGLTGTGELVGTVAYVSPEQIRGEAVDARADVYALACMLYECLAGDPPFERETEVATLWAHVHEPPATLSASRPELGTRIDAVLSKGLAKSPEERYGSCGELVGAAGTALGFPDRAAPRRPSVPRAARVRLPRGRRLLALLAAAALILVAAVAAFVLLSGSGGTATVGSTSVGVIDSATRKVVGEVPVGFRTSLIAAGEGYVWLVDPEASTLTKIDPRTEKVVSTRGVPADGVPIGLAAGEGSVWVAVNQGRTLGVLQIGPELGDLRGTVTLERSNFGSFSVVRETVVLTVGAGAVWALERGRGEVTRIDPRTRRPKLMAEGLGASSSIAAGGRAVWLGGINGVTKLDADSGAELGSTFVAQVLESQATSIAVGRGATWFVGSASPRLWQIDSSGNTVVDSVTVGAHPSGVTVGPDGIVWVANSGAASVSYLDPKADSAVTVELGASPGGVVAAFDRIWTSPGTPTA